MYKTARNYCGPLGVSTRVLSDSSWKIFNADGEQLGLVGGNHGGLTTKVMEV